MGLCNSKPSSNPTLSSRNSDTQNNPFPVTDSTEPHSSSVNGENPTNRESKEEKRETENGRRSPFFPFYSPSPAHYLFSKKSPANSSSNSTPRRFFKRPSPAKHIKALLARRHGSVKPNEATIEEGSEGGDVVAMLDKNFGFSKHFGNKYDVGGEIGRGHFGYTCAAKFKKGDMKGQQVAVKVISKAKVLFLLTNCYS